MSSENFSLGPNWQMKNFQLTNSEDRRAYNSEGGRDGNSKGNLSRERKREMESCVERELLVAALTVY